jgi:tetratricopeptide (TPR) repeat protein
LAGTAYNPDDVKPGRNEPCPCGSGKKYKKCCGQVLPGPTPPAASIPRSESPTSAELDQRIAAARNLGIEHFNAGRADDALASFQQAVTLRPTDASLHSQLGDLLFALSRHDEALSSYQRALRLNPDLIEAHNNLGNAWVKLGRLPQAIEAYHRVLQLKPDSAETHSNLSKVLSDLHRFGEAIQSSSRAITINPGLAEAHANLGNALLDSDQPVPAIASYRRAVQLKPDFPEAWNSLGNALRSVGEFDDALQSYHRALERRPDYAEAHSNLGVALRLLGRTQEAEAYCRRALELQPDSALILSALGEIHADRGQFVEAAQMLWRAVALDPNLVEAWVSLGRLRKMTPEDDSWLAQVQRLLGQPLRPRERISLHYAIGKYFDDLKQFDDAFGHCQRANELTRQHVPRHDRIRVARETDNLIRVYSAERLPAMSARGNASERPVFIIGMPRSGTSLAEQILASHPQVFGAGELSYWHAAAEKLNAQGQGGEPEATTLHKLADEYLRLLDSRSADAHRVVDKMPTNFMAAGLIHAALPNARFIHMQRNPVDTCLSIYFQDFGARISYANDLGDLENFYREYLRLMRHWGGVLPPSALLEVPYEGLVADQELWSRRMIEFIALPWDERCLEFERTERSVVTASKWQVRQRINTASIERWRRYQKYIGPLRSLLEDGAH